MKVYIESKTDVWKGNSMQKIKIEEIKQIEFEMLQYAKSICEKNGIKYYLGYGTLLGAVRHKGFIPWDDDVDIVLFRDGYERFVQAVDRDNHEYIKIIHMKNSDSFFGPYAMLVDTRTTMAHYKLKEEIIEGMGVYIDVFPLDQFNDLETAKKKMARSKKLKALNNLTMVKTFQYDKGLKGLGKKVIAPFANLIGHRRICEKIERLADDADTESGKYVMDLMWDPVMRWCVPKEAYDNIIMLEFEGEVFSAPEDYDSILRSGYGDYMQFPPEEERNTGHCNIFYWKE